MTRLQPFVATWPITRDLDSWEDVQRQAVADLPALAADAGCRIDGAPKFAVVRAAGVPPVLVAVAAAVNLRPARQPVANKRRRRTKPDG